MYSKLFYFYQIFGCHYLKNWTWHLLAIICILTLDPRFFLISFAIFLIVTPLIQVISHDYVSHEYITPKNRFYQFLVLGLWYLLGQTVQNKKNYHYWHHINWQNRNIDPTQKLLANKSFFRYLFSLHFPVDNSIPIVLKGSLVNSPSIRMLDKYSIHIYWTSLIAMIIFLPWTWFVTLIVYPTWLQMLIERLHDYYFHGGGPKKDTAWLLFLFGSASWHIHHHRNWHDEYHGPEIWKWFNLCWYFRQIMFIKNMHEHRTITLDSIIIH